MQAGLLAILGGAPNAAGPLVVAPGEQEPEQTLLPNTQLFQQVLDEQQAQQLVQQQLQTAQTAIAFDEVVIEHITVELAGLSADEVPVAPVAQNAELLAQADVRAGSVFADLFGNQPSALLAAADEAPTATVRIEPIIAGQEQAQNTILSATQIELPADEAEITLNQNADAAAQEVLERLLSVQQITDVTEEDVVAVAALASNALPIWQAQLQERRAEVAASGGANTATTQTDVASVAQALVNDDVALLSDAELAKLDALVEQIGNRTLSAGGQNFQQLLQEVGIGSSQAAEGETLQQLSSLSAGHASNQTHSQDDRLGVRIYQAAPTQQQGHTTPQEQVKVSIQQALQSGFDRVHVQLDPADLGRVDVRIELASDGRAQLYVQAESKETLDLLQRDARLLAEALQEAGIDADAQDMAFDLSEGNDGQDETGTNDASDSIQNITTAQEVPLASQQEQATNYTLSIAQGLDIKV